MIDTIYDVVALNGDCANYFDNLISSHQSRKLAFNWLCELSNACDEYDKLDKELNEIYHQKQTKAVIDKFLSVQLLAEAKEKEICAKFNIAVRPRLTDYKIVERYHFT